MSTEDQAAPEIATVYVRYGLDYNGAKGPVARVRQIAGLTRPRDRKRPLDSSTAPIPKVPSTSGQADDGAGADIDRAALKPSRLFAW